MLTNEVVVSSTSNKLQLRQQWSEVHEICLKRLEKPFISENLIQVKISKQRSPSQSSVDVDKATASVLWAFLICGEVRKKGKKKKREKRSTGKTQRHQALCNQKLVPNKSNKQQ